MYAQLSSSLARSLVFVLSLHLLPYSVYVSSKGSGQTGVSGALARLGYLGLWPDWGIWGSGQTGGSGALARLRDLGLWPDWGIWGSP